MKVDGHFGSNDRPQSSWTVHFYANDRLGRLKTAHFWIDYWLSRVVLFELSSLNMAWKLIFTKNY